MSAALGKTPMFIASEFYPAGELNPQPNGLYTLTIDGNTGEVLSVIAGPSGPLFGKAPSGSNGPSQLCGLNGNVLVFCPDGLNLYAFPYYTSVPNI